MAADRLVVVKRLTIHRDDPLAQLVSPVPYEIARNLAANDIEEISISSPLGRRDEVPVGRTAKTIELAVADIDVASG